MNTVTKPINKIIDNILENRNLDNKIRFYNLVRFLLKTMKESRKGIAEMPDQISQDPNFTMNGLFGQMASLMLLMEIELGDFSKFLEEDYEISDDQVKNVDKKIKTMFETETDNFSPSFNFTKPSFKPSPIFGISGPNNSEEYSFSEFNFNAPYIGPNLGVNNCPHHENYFENNTGGIPKHMKFKKSYPHFKYQKVKLSELENKFSNDQGFNFNPNPELYKAAFMKKFKN